MLIDYDEALKMIDKNLCDSILSISLYFYDKELDTKCIPLNFANNIIEYGISNEISSTVIEEINNYINHTGYTSIMISLELKAGKHHDRLKVKSELSKRQLYESKYLLEDCLIPMTIKNCFVEMLYLLVN